MADSQSDLILRFRQAREDAGLSQQDAADHLGVSVASVSRKELGKQTVTLRDVVTMERIRDDLTAGRLGVMRDEFLAKRQDADNEVRQRLDRLVDAFRMRMVRAGATDEQAGYVLARARLYIEGVLIPAREPDPDSDLTTYLNEIVRPRAEAPVIGAIQEPPTPGGAPMARYAATKDPTGAATGKPKIDPTTTEPVASPERPARNKGRKDRE